MRVGGVAGSEAFRTSGTGIVPAYRVAEDWREDREGWSAKSESEYESGEEVGESSGAGREAYLVGVGSGVRRPVGWRAERPVEGRVGVVGYEAC